MDLTFLEAEVPLTKTFAMESGELKKIGHPRILDYKSHVEDFETIEDFHEHLVAHAALNHCLLKGNLTRQLEWESRKGTTDPNATSRWICFDLDGMRGVATPRDFMQLIGLADVDYVEQFSSSSGVVPDRGLSCHIYAMVDRDVAAPTLKQSMMHYNLSIPVLRSALGLTRTNNALRWSLDVSTCQNDKLIYIAPPILQDGVKDGFEGQRIRLVKGTRRAMSFDKTPNAELNKKEALKALNQLRAAAGLEERKRSEFKTHGTVEYMAKPDRATVSGVRRERGFVYLNLNGGDSYAYYHPETNPEFILNFKGEPAYRTKDLLPDYWSEVREKVNGPRVDEQGNVCLAFRSFRTADYWNGMYYKATGKLDLAKAKSEGQLRGFLMQHGQPVGDFTPDWDMVYDPESSAVVQEAALPRPVVNIYKPSVFEGHEQEKVAEVPPMTAKVLRHVLGNDEDAYQYTLNWFAVILQTKRATGTAGVWHGVQGTGKGLILNHVLRPIFGDSNVVSKRMSEFDSQFNGFMENALIVWVDDAPEADSFARAPQMDANMKNYICEPMISIRHMFAEPYEVRNRSNMLFSANNHSAVIPPPDDRRFTIAAFQQDKLITILPDTDLVAEELDKEAWHTYCYLAQRPVDAKAARTPLVNAAKTQMISINRMSLDSVVDAVLGGNYQFFVDQKPADVQALPRSMHDRATLYCGLVDRMRDFTALGREEIFTLVHYIVGDGISSAPGKLTATLKRHRIHLSSQRRGKDNFRGVKVEWKTQT